MSDKRASTAEYEASVKKRKVLDSLSESGPWTQKDVVYFQKEAIYRQLVHYKSNSSILHSELSNYSQKYNLYKDKLLLVLTWLDQFIEFVANLAPNDSFSTSSDYLISIDLDSNDELSKELNDKKTKLNKLLSNLSSNKSPEFVENLSILSKQLNELKFSKNELAKKIGVISSNYDSLHDKYLELLKLNERLNSKTLERFSIAKKDVEEVKKEDTPKSATPVPTSSADQEELEELKSQLKEQSSTIETQEKIINDHLLKLKKLNDENSKKREDQSSSKSPDGTKISKEYSDLSIKYDSLRSDNDDLLQKFNVLQENFINLEKNSNLLTDVLNSKFSKEKEKVIENFAKLENDLIRIRTARDELLSKVSILETEKSNSTLIKELKSLLESQQQIFESKESIEIIGDEDLNSLKQKNLILNQELQSLEKAFKSLQSSQFEKISKIFDFDSQLSKYKIEKQKADQKYFAAMRSKDSLVQEIRTSKDLIKALELKNTSLEELKTFSKDEFLNLEGQLTNSHKILQLKEREIATLNQRMAELETKQKSLQEKSTSLQETQSSTSEEYSTLLKSETELKLKLSRVESQLSTTREQLSRYKTQGKEAVNQEELNQYRSLIYCSLCSKNWKNTVIKNCGHFFCEECTKERLAARMRKCPSCNKQFSSNDLLTVHL